MLWGGGEEELVFNEHKVSVWDDENALEFDDGDGCTANVKVLNATDLCI